MRKLGILLGMVCMLGIGSFAVSGQSGQEVCLVNETDGSRLVFFLTTGDFKYVAGDGFATSGTGQVKTEGCTTTFNANNADVAIVADVNLCDRFGKAAIQIIAQGFAGERSIADSNLNDNGCVSAPPPTEGEPIEEPPMGEWVCIQDADSIFVFHTRTGDYKYNNCADGTAVSGTGQVTTDGCKSSLEDIRTNIRVVASVDICLSSGKASVETFQTTSTKTGKRAAVTPAMNDVVADSNLRDNTCSCSAK